MKGKEIIYKTLAGLMIASMSGNIVAPTAFAATGATVAKDGTYSATAKVARTEADDEDENEWDEYSVTVTLTVKDGKFEAVTVTPDSAYNEADNQSYFSKAATKSKGIVRKLTDLAATEDSVNTFDGVSGATRTSKAVKDAALEAIHQAEEAQAEVVVDVTALEAAVKDAEEVVEKDYTADSFKAFAQAFSDAKSALAAKESQEKVDAAEAALKSAKDALVKAVAETEAPEVKESETAAPETKESETKETEAEEKIEYVLMNIPYDEFYKADINNSVRVDAFSSATKSKPKSSLAAGSYHANTDASKIDGVTFPVKVAEGTDLSKYKRVTDADSIEITTTMRGQTSTTTYAGKEALFENDTYAYYVLNETPSYYKEATVNADGSLSFGKTVGTVTTLSSVTPDLRTTSRYGDYQLNLDGLTDVVPTSEKIYGVVVSTKEGHDYGMRHLENIWRVSELAWSTGFTTEVHGCKTDSEHYKAMMGETINKVTYYTSKGIYEIPMDVYVPAKFESTVEVANADVASGETTVKIEGLPADYQAEYAVEGLDFNIKGEKLTFKDAKNGNYKLSLSDKGGKYAGLDADFTLTTSEMPAAFNDDAQTPALTAADGVSEEKFADYLANISEVTVNGKTYSASGRGAVAVIDKKTGAINLNAEANGEKVFANAGIYEVSVAANSYTTPLAFNINKTDDAYVYAYAGLTWAEFWAAEGVQAAGSTASSDVADTKGELDKGAFDAVSRATTTHGLHRGSYQGSATIYMKDGKTYDVAYYTGRTTAVLTDGTEITYNAADIDHYIVTGLKYVPVKVAKEDYEAFKEAYKVVENNGTLSGGFSENKLQAYTGVVANVTDHTNGLKSVTKNADGTFAFSSRQSGEESGIKDAALKTATGAEATVKEASGSYGEFLRVDINGDYGDLAANMQAVKWTYYGKDSTYATPLATYGTKFAADNWMHKAMGIQLGLTDSLRATLPEGTDGTGYWTLTVYALGYEDYTVKFEATDANIVKADPVTDTSALEAAIAKAEALKESDYTAESWAKMQGELAEAKAELEAKHSQSAVEEATNHLNAAIDDLEKVQEDRFVLMNIPYDAFYKADINNDVRVDAFSSATMAKPKSGLAAGSYHANTDASKIDGVTFPVKVSGNVDLSKYKQVTDADSVELTTTMRGQTSTTTYAGKEALFENDTYAYYVLNETPDYYKELTVNEDGSLSFGKTVGNVTKLDNVTAELSTTSRYGDYQLDLDGLTDVVPTSEKVYGVIVSTKEGHDYGMRHLENIWRVSELAWSTGFTTEVHGCKTDSEHYKAMMGETINKVTYYTSKGIYEIAVNEYVPVKFESTLSVEDAAAASGKTNVVIEKLPADYDAEYSVEGLDITVDDAEFAAETVDKHVVLNFKDAVKGQYTLTVSDKKGKYADISTSFTLYTESMPAVYADKKLNKAADASEEEFADFIKNITNVTVGDNTYAATGRGATVIINEDGTIKEDAAPFAEGDTFEVTVTATGYKPLSFTYSTKAPETPETEAPETETPETKAPETETPETKAPETKAPETKSVDTAALEKTIAKAEALKEADYTEKSWTSLQSALTNAKKAVTDKKSQDSVDKANKTLQTAMDKLAKKTTASKANTGKAGTTTTAANTANKTASAGTAAKSTSTSAPKTGDTFSIFGTLSVALASMGLGGIALKLRGKKKEDEEA